MVRFNEFLRHLLYKLVELEDQILLELKSQENASQVIYTPVLIAAHQDHMTSDGLSFGGIRFANVYKYYQSYPALIHFFISLPPRSLSAIGNHCLDPLFHQVVKS